MGVCRICQGGANYYLGGGGGACDAWHRHAFASGVRGHASPKKKKLFCNLVRFGSYFHIFLFSKSLKMSFLYTNNYKL